MRGWIICAVLTLALSCPGLLRASTPEQMQAQIDALQAQVDRLQQQVAALTRQLAEQNRPTSPRYAPFSLIPLPPTTQPFYGPIQIVPRPFLPRYNNSNTWHEVLPLQNSAQQP